MTGKRGDAKTEVENSFQTAKQDYEMGEALLDLLETAIQGVEKYIADASTSTRDDVRRLTDHTIRVRELVLRLLETQNRLDELVSRLLDVRNTLDAQLVENTSPKPVSRSKH